MLINERLKFAHVCVQNPYAKRALYTHTYICMVWSLLLQILGMLLEAPYKGGFVHAYAHLSLFFYRHGVVLHKAPYRGSFVKPVGTSDTHTYMDISLFTYRYRGVLHEAM